LAPLYFEQAWARKLYNLGDHSYHDLEVEMAVYTFEDAEHAFEKYLPMVLASGVRVLTYNGGFDFAANYVGGLNWANALNYTGQKAFNRATHKNWYVDGIKAGWTKSASNFTFVFVEGSGHMVPMDQPKRAFHMISKYLNHEDM